MIRSMVTAEKETSRPQQAGRIKDARGRSATQLDPVMMHLLHRHGVIPPGVLREMAREIGIGMTRASRIAFWLGLLGIACCLIGLAIGLARLSAGTIQFRRFVATMVPYCGIWVPLFAVWAGTRNARHSRLAGVMLKHLHCPHCGYDIRGLPTAAEDGATVCPECGCAWKLDDAEIVASDGGDRQSA